MDKWPKTNATINPPRALQLAQGEISNANRGELQLGFVTMNKPDVKLVGPAGAGALALLAFTASFQRLPDDGAISQTGQGPGPYLVADFGVGFLWMKRCVSAFILTSSHASPGRDPRPATRPLSTRDATVSSHLPHHRCRHFQHPFPPPIPPSQPCRQAPRCRTAGALS